MYLEFWKGGLGHGERMEHELITGVWDKTPGENSGGLRPPEAGDILRSNSSISAVKIHYFAIFSNVCMPPLMKQIWQSVHSDKVPWCMQI